MIHMVAYLVLQTATFRARRRLQRCSVRYLLHTATDMQGEKNGKNIKFVPLPPHHHLVTMSVQREDNTRQFKFVSVILESWSMQKSDWSAIGVRKNSREFQCSLHIVHQKSIQWVYYGILCLLMFVVSVQPRGSESWNPPARDDEIRSNNLSNHGWLMLTSPHWQAMNYCDYSAYTTQIHRIHRNIGEISVQQRWNNRISQND